MGRYINQEAVIVRLRNKVKVTEDPEMNPDRLPSLLLNRLINEAEGQVEMDLSTRYAAPFQTIQGNPFSQLPERPTREILRTLCELIAVQRVLETDFGKGSGVNADAYIKWCDNRYIYILHGDYERKIPGLITLREDTYNTFRLPPLPGLMSNAHVAAVDTGFAGFIARSDDHGAGGYPMNQINDPSQNFWNGHIDPDQQDFTGNAGGFGGDGFIGG